MHQGDPGPAVCLAAIGDIHAHRSRLERVIDRIAAERVDAVLLVGDLGSHHLSLRRLRTPERDELYLRSIEELFLRLGRLRVPVLWVPGNHDLPDLAGPGNVDGRAAGVAGIRVAGIGGAGPARFGFSYEWSDRSVRARELPACDVLLCHAPPARTTLDVLARGGKHVGSEAIRERALAHDGALVCGHIHEAPGAEQLGRCLCLNVGGLGEPYGRAQVGFLRRDGRLEGLWRAEHEDLETGTLRTWTRVAASVIAPDRG